MASRTVAGNSNATNPWLEVREPLRDTKYPERDRASWHEWLGCISVVNNDILQQLSGTVEVFDYLSYRNSFCLGFGRQIRANEGCPCGRQHLHTHFILKVIGKVERSTAYQMACAAFLKLQLKPEDHYTAFSYLASVYEMELLSDMLCQLPEEYDNLAQKLKDAPLISYPELH